MKVSSSAAIASISCSLLICSTACAQTEESPQAEGTPSSSAPRAIHFFGAQRVWVGTWDASLIDVRLDQTAQGPVIQSSNPSAKVDEAFPLTSLGVRYADWSISTSIIPRTRASSDEVGGGSIYRSEYDINLGYAINQNVSAAIIYKVGRINNIFTPTASQLMGSSGTQDLTGWLVGMSGSKSLVQNLSMYGNIAVGVGRVKVDLGQLGERNSSLDYRVGEIGLSYTLPGISFASVSLQAGYRVQVVDVNDAEMLTLSASQPVTQLSSSTQRIKSTTQGFVVGLAVAF